MEDLIFIEDEEADGRDQKIIGILSADGTWQGDRWLEYDVRTSMQKHNLSLSNIDDRTKLLQIFSGPFLFSMEAKDWNGEVVLMI